MKKFKTSERILISISLVVFSMALYLSISQIPVWQLLFVKSWKDFSWNQLQQSSPIGQIKWTNGEGLQRKQKNQMVFKSLVINQDLFLGDTVKSDDKTSAVISLNTGEEINLSPSSMVVLTFEETEKSFSGLVSKPKIKVVPAKKEEAVKVEKPVVELKDKLSKIKIESLVVPTRAVAQVKPSKLQTFFAKPPEPVVVKEEPIVAPPPKVEEKVVAKPPEPVKVFEPVKIDSFLSMPGGTDLSDNKLRDRQMDKFFMLIKWNPVPKATDYKIQVFDGSQKLLLEDRTIDPVYKLYENKVFNGDIFYQVIAFHGNRAIGKTLVQKKTFSFLPPDLKMPLSGTVSKQPVTFTWTKTNFTEDYVLEIASDEGFSKKITKKIKDNFHQVRLNPGKYYWRVYSSQGAVYSSPSKAILFEVK